MSTNTAAPITVPGINTQAPSITTRSPIASCNPNPCLNGGNCTLNAAGTYSCTCCSPYYGQNCEYSDQPNRWTACSSNPCLNNGLCIPTLNSFQCVCASNFYGQQCQNHLTFSDNKLSPQGELLQRIRSLSNLKTLLFDSTTNLLKRSSIQSCESKPCLNGGTCHELESVLKALNTKIICMCATGYTGFYCETTTQ